MANGILVPVVDFTGMAEDEFNDWYDFEHITERLRVLGFLACERWIGAENQGAAACCAGRRATRAPSLLGVSFRNLLTSRTRARKVRACDDTREPRRCGQVLP